MNRMLLVVDPQIDFITGTLPVPGAEEAMNGLANAVLADPGRWAHVVVTTDWHPPAHCSFKANGGQWPVHCVADSNGAAIWPVLANALASLDVAVDILHKGMAAEKEEYSIFCNPSAALQIRNIISKKNIGAVDICGVAGDVCVLNTLRDGVRAYGREMFHCLRDFSPSLDGGLALAAFCGEDSCAR